MVKLKSFRWITIFMLIVTALVGSAVLAQDNAPISFELVGNIEAMNASSIAVHGHNIDISAAEISVTLEVGLAVRVHGTVLTNGSIVASEVNAAENDDILPGEAKIIGVWPGVVGSTVVVGGVTLDLSGAEIDASIVAGDLVVVHATLSPEGIWVVREVSPFEADTNDNGNDNTDDNSNDNGNTNDNGNDNADDNSNDNTDDNSNDNSNGGTTDEFELTGTLENIGDGFIVVSGATIDTTSAEIHGNLIVGALVKVHVLVIDGRMTAREVELVSQDNSSGNDNNTDDNSNDNSSGDDNQNDNTDDNGNDNGNDNSDDNGNDNEDGSLPTIPGDCVASMPAGWTTYTIQSGDTLSSIASRAGTNVGDLMQVNCIANPGMIVAGTTIFVPRTPAPVGNSNDNSDDNDNTDDNGNDNASDDNGNDNRDDNGNDNASDDNGNDNADDHGGDNNNDNNDDNGGGNDNGDDNGGHGNGGDD